jgi:NAD(P)H-quinone oxidoreductase subunit 5
VADAAFLIAAVALHHMHGEGQFAAMVGQWPEVSPDAGHVTSQQALIVGLLLLIAVAGKSALIPFSGWLPRAMEGPTPSSAIFYGALSVHLGAFLLLRFSPLLALSPVLCCVVIVLGIATAILASISGRVQADVKTALAFASLMQVGIITTEIGVAGLLPQRLGYAMEYLALVHIIGHACLRTLQLLRAPNLLHDYHVLENALGAHLPSQEGRGKLVPDRFQVAMYRLGIERGYLDAFINEYVARPFVAVFRWFDGLERRWTDAISGNGASAGEHPPPLTTEELS